MMASQSNSGAETNNMQAPTASCHSARKGSAGIAGMTGDSRGFVVSDSHCMRYVGGAMRIKASNTSKPKLAGWAKSRAWWCGRNAVKSVQRVCDGMAPVSKFESGDAVLVR